MSIENPILSAAADLAHSSLSRPSTSVENSLQIKPFYAKQTQFPKSQMIVNTYNTTDYKNKSNWTLGENKPNSNPIKPNFKKAKMNANVFVTKDYGNETAFRPQKNKPNSNPISVKPKMNVNLYVIKEYENETTFRLRKNKPKQTQFLYHWPRLLFIISGLCKKSRYINSALLARESRVE